MIYTENPIIKTIQEDRKINDIKLAKDINMNKYKVTLNNSTIGIVYAKNIQDALNKAVVEYGLECDVTLFIKD